MLLLLIILDSDCIGADHNIIVVCILGKFSVKIGDLHIESSGVLDRECLKVQLAKDVDILAIDITHRHLEYLLLGLAHSINLSKVIINQISNGVGKDCDEDHGKDTYLLAACAADHLEVDAS